MPDPNRQLTRAVVEIATQVRRLADALNPSDQERARRATTTGDDGPERRLDHVRAALAKAQQHHADTDPSERQDCVMCGSDHLADIAAVLGQPASEQQTSPAERDLRRSLEIATAELRTLRAGIRALGGDPTTIQNLWAQIRMRNRQWRETKRELRLTRSMLDEEGGDVSLVDEMLATVAAAEQQRDQLAATLREVLATFVHETHPGRRCLQSGHINVGTVERWRAVLDQPATEEQR